jgi:RNA polymerase sigma-70 factor (ECF subfamily)
MPRSDQQTIQLIRQARAGSQVALGRLFDGCRLYLLRIASNDLDRRLHAKASASDLVQETFLGAHLDFGEFRGDSEQALLAWLRHRLRYRLAKLIRSYRETAKRDAGREVPLDDRGSSSAVRAVIAAKQRSPSEYAIAGERSRQVEAALERLPNDHGRVIHLRYRERLSVQETDRALGRYANSARKLWGRAIERLDRELREMFSS